MAAAEFLKAEARVLVYEGGKANNPADPGGRTNEGVTQATYNAYRRADGLAARDVYLMADAERDAIYKARYWDEIDGDALPMGVGFCVFDAGVNSGPGQATKWLQASLGAHYAGEIDGGMGPKTLQAVEDFGNPADLIEEFCSRRLGTLEHLSDWSEFGKGWHARISNVQKIAVSWAGADTPSSQPEVLPVDVTSLGGHNRAKVTGNIKQPPVSQITAHITTAATSVGTVASQAAQQVQPLADTFGWIKYVFGGLTLAAVVAGILIKFSSDASTAAAAGTAHASVDPDADANLPAVKVVDAPVTPPVKA